MLGQSEPSSAPLGPGSGPPGVLSAEAVSLLDMLPDCVALFEQGADGTLRPCLRNRAFRAGLPGLGEGGALPEALEQALRKVFAGAASATAVLELRPGAQPRWFELLVRPYPPAAPTSAPVSAESEPRPAQDRGSLALVHAADVTQRVRGERAHRESESLLGAILETCAVGLCLCDQRGRFVSVNRAFCELFGFRPEELIGRMFSKILPPEEHDHAVGMFQEFMTGERKSGDTQELRARRRDGTVLEVRLPRSRR